MPRNDDLELNELLAGGQLSGTEYDAIEANVLERVAPRSRSPRVFAVLLPGLGLAAAVALWVSASSRQPHQPSLDANDAFRAKGGNASGSTLPVGSVELGCASRPSGTCRLGDTLMFSINTSVASGYLAAFAQRGAGARGERIWYFPTAGGDAPRLTPGQGTRVVPQGVRLGAPHTPGRYTITVWLSDTAPSREDVDHLGELSSQELTLVIAP